MKNAVNQNLKTNKKPSSALISCIAGLLIAISMRLLVFENVIIPTESMVPTIAINDKFIGSRLSYIFAEPERGDIIVFDNPDSPNESFIKRVIGLPGETVTIIDGKIYINGSSTPLDEPYINSEDAPTGDFGPYNIPDDCYFVLGDNRNHSYDSRFWTTTNFVHRDSITSKAVIKYSPEVEIINNN